MSDRMKGAIGGIFIALIVISIVSYCIYNNYKTRHPEPITFESVTDQFKPENLLTGNTNQPQQPVEQTVEQPVEPIN